MTMEQGIKTALSNELPASANLIRTDRRAELVHLGLVLILVNTILIVWSCYDHSLPVYDIACHLMSGFACCDLLAHMHIRSVEWWHSLFAINPLYPPFVYFVYGVFKLILGPQRWVEVLVRLIFSNVLFLSLYGLGRLIFERASVGLLSVLMILIFPQVFALMHYDMLDMPGLAMVSLALFCLTWWQKRPTIYSSICLGISCALTALTKNNCVAFLLVPLAVILGEILFKRNWQQIKSFILAGLVGLIVMLPWLITASHSMFSSVASIQKQKYQAGFMENISYYLSNLPCWPSQFLLIIFILALCLSSKAVHRRMQYLLCSGLGGIFILSIFRWIPQSRYELPVSIPMALYCAQAGLDWWSRLKIRPFLIAAAILTSLGFIEEGFTPYPMPRLSLPSRISEFFGIEPSRQDYHFGPGGISNYPSPPADWGYQWVLDTIQPSLKKAAIRQSLAIMPNSEEVSGTIYSYLVRQKNLVLNAFTPRCWTMLGDELGYSANGAMLINWYLLKTGDPGSHFADKASKDAYEHWCSFVRTSGRFKLVGSKLLPDNSELELYRNLFY